MASPDLHQDYACVTIWVQLYSPAKSREPREGFVWYDSRSIRSSSRLWVGDVGTPSSSQESALVGSRPSHLWQTSWTPGGKKSFSSQMILLFNHLVIFISPKTVSINLHQTNFNRLIKYSKI